MNEPMHRRRDGRDHGDAVVRSLTPAAARRCARSGCPAAAQATLVFSYVTREVWIDHLGDSIPHTYDLCTPHALRTRPPSGWQLHDRRPADERGGDPTEAAPLGGAETVSVLAAALRAVPDPPAAPDVPATRQAPEATGAVSEDDPSPVLAHGAATARDDAAGSPMAPGVAPDGEPAAEPRRHRTPKPILATRRRDAPPPPSPSPSPRSPSPPPAHPTEGHAADW